MSEDYEVRLSRVEFNLALLEEVVALRATGYAERLRKVEDIVEHLDRWRLKE
jgi:hypothetical protein